MTTGLDELHIDERDVALLRLLEADSRLPTATLARRLGLSRTTVQARLDRLVDRGVIQAFTVRLADPITARQVRGHVLITAAPKAARGIEADKLRGLLGLAIDAVEEAFVMHGIHPVRGEFG